MAEQMGNTRPVAGQEGDQSEDTQDKRRWTDEEDVQLCKSWKVVSQCPAVGTNQKKNDLWLRVKRHFDANWPKSRSSQSLQGRWKILKIELYEWHCALRQAKNWYKSGSNAVDEQDEAHKLWHVGMKRKTGKAKRHNFQSFDSYVVVEGFAQFKDIPSHTSGGTSNVGSHPQHTQPIAENSPINLDMDVDEVIAGETADPNVRPQGRKAAKEAIRKAKKAAKEGSPYSSSLESIANNQIEATKGKKKLDDEFARSLQEEEKRACILLQIEMRKEQLLFQERQDRIKEMEERIKEREERIMEIDTSKMTPNKKRYWSRKQKKIAEKEDLDEQPPPSMGGYYPQPNFGGGMLISKFYKEFQYNHIVSTTIECLGEQCSLYWNEFSFDWSTDSLHAWIADSDGWVYKSQGRDNSSIVGNYLEEADYLPSVFASFSRNVLEHCYNV
ncbi:uncharacterized protein LOC133737533 [Rosa rugosa]|uniref:uncharacterized protein LOC133737533 n=1 Tax=Rosa rugosa TaxID=74645 RepID=UPI002B40A4E0|nr:uncharacterized protein LOC133737533 [Rosa rugosa]